MTVREITPAERIAALNEQVRDLEAQLAAVQQAPALPEAPACPFPPRPVTLGEFAADILRPMIADAPKGAWCEQWNDHPLLAYLFNVAYENWPHPLLPPPRWP